MGAYTLYTDGSCSGNPGPGGWAYILTEPWDTETEASGGDTRTTNNAMELSAAIKGLRATPPGSSVTVFADSEYVVKGITQWITGWLAKGWRNASGEPVKNADLWRDLWHEVSLREVEWQWVKGHAANHQNNRVDALARAQTRRYKDGA